MKTQLSKPARSLVKYTDRETAMLALKQTSTSTIGIGHAATQVVIARSALVTRGRA